MASSTSRLLGKPRATQRPRPQNCRKSPRGPTRAAGPSRAPQTHTARRRPISRQRRRGHNPTC
eukprot:3352084-Lingulodinium_polyedra.AAC.1